MDGDEKNGGYGRRMEKLLPFGFSLLAGLILTDEKKMDR
jgi:hypothetical protein